MEQDFGEFGESDINHWSMHWFKFKDPVYHMCLAGAVGASWSFTQKVAGDIFDPFYCKDKYFCHWIQWKHLRKTQIFMLSEARRIFLQKKLKLDLEKVHEWALKLFTGA